MTLAERIEKAQADLQTKKDTLAQTTLLLEAAPDEESLLIEVEELSGTVEKASSYLGALKKAEAALAVKAVPVMPSAGGGVNAPALIHQTKAVKDGNILFKYGVASFIASVKGRHIDEVFAERYADQPAVKAVHDLVKKAATTPGTTFTDGWAAELVQEGVVGFLGALTPLSFGAALASASQALTFGGYDSISVPRMNNIASPRSEPAWVGEGGVIPVTTFSFAAQKFNRYKLAAITTFTRELAERSTPAIEAILQTALRQSYALVLDHALISDLPAVPGVRPAGMLNGVVPIPASAASGLEAIVEDMKALVSAHMGNLMGARPVLLINDIDRLSASLVQDAVGSFPFQADVNAGRLLGVPLISSPNIPQGTAVMVDAANFALALDAPDFQTSTVAALVQADAGMGNPTHNDGTPGQVGRGGGIPISGAVAAGAVAQSLWQTDSIGVRMIAPTTFGFMRPLAVQVIDGINW
jgi:hypothetical protein